MATEERNGWLVFEWGQTMRVAITTSPWESELMVVILLPAIGNQEGLYHSALLPVDPTPTLQHIQRLFGLTRQRAEYLHRAVLEALATFYTEEEPQPPPIHGRIIPIIPV